MNAGLAACAGLHDESLLQQVFLCCCDCDKAASGAPVKIM
jgi:hypothetical protein